MPAWIVVSSTLLLLIAAIALARVTRRMRRAERALAICTTELQKARHMATVGRLAAGLAHDFSNLLIPVIACSELLMTRRGGGQDARELLAIHEAGLRARDLVRRLLVQNRLELRMQTIDPARMLDSLRLFLDRFVTAGIELVVCADGAIPAMRADPAHIERVIVNLVSNAVAAIGRERAVDGRIVVRLAFERLDAVRARLLDVTVGGYVRITVEDNGPGMDVSVQARLFEPFFSTKRAEGGSGLGLAAVRDVVVQHGGGIAFVSEPRRGSRFDVYVPAAELADAR
jgi:signal transduction histidine kinase